MLIAAARPQRRNCAESRQILPVEVIFAGITLVPNAPILWRKSYLSAPVSLQSAAARSPFQGANPRRASLRAEFSSFAPDEPKVTLADAVSPRTNTLHPVLSEVVAPRPTLGCQSLSATSPFSSARYHERVPQRVIDRGSFHRYLDSTIKDYLPRVCLQANVVCPPTHPREIDRFSCLWCRIGCARLVSHSLSFSFLTRQLYLRHARPVCGRAAARVSILVRLVYVACGCFPSSVACPRPVLPLRQSGLARASLSRAPTTAPQRQTPSPSA